MTTRREFVAGSAALAGALLHLTADAQSPAGVIHELSGQVRLDDAPLARNHAIQPGQTLATGADGRVAFTLGGDAYFLRPNTRLRVEPFTARDRVVQALRLFTGALGATFRRGDSRSVVTSTVTIGIRGTGIYLESTPEETYACTCFGATEMQGLRIAAQNHQARRIYRDPQTGMRIVSAPFERHTNGEMVRLESLAGRPNPFSS